MIGFDNCFTVDVVGKKSCNALLSKSEIKLEIKNYFQYHIHSKICDETLGLDWFLTGFYGQLKTSKRSVSWELFDRINLGSNLG